jgi:lipopolysaccharide export LptBFGC system permease protein LptF
MTTIKHWEEMTENKESNIFAIVRENRTLSIPNYLKGKISISFQDDEQYDKSLNYLITQIKKNMDNSSNRPVKTKTLKDKPINYFQFDRVEDILAIIAKKRERIDFQLDYSGKNRIKYEYWKISNFQTHSFILILFNNITIKDTVERFIQKNTAAGLDTVVYQVDYHSKISFAFAGIVMCLLGLPFSVGRARSGGTMVNVGICLGLIFVYYVFYSSGLTMGQQGAVSPVLAAWIPNIVMSIFALFLLKKAKR